MKSRRITYLPVKTAALTCWFPEIQAGSAIKLNRFPLTQRRQRANLRVVTRSTKVSQLNGKPRRLGDSCGDRRRKPLRVAIEVMRRARPIRHYVMKEKLPH